MKPRELTEEEKEELRMQFPKKKKLTKEEINLIITLLTRFLTKETGKYEEFIMADNIIRKLSEN